MYSRDVKLFHLVELRLCTHWTMAFYCPLPSAPGEHHSVTCFCEADYFGYFTLSGIMEYLCFGNWLISVRIISSEFAHVIAYNRIFHKGNWSMRCCWICLCVGKRGSEASSSAILLRSLLSDYFFFFLYNLIVGFSLLVVPSLMWEITNMFLHHEEVFSVLWMLSHLSGDILRLCEYPF